MLNSFASVTFPDGKVAPIVLPAGAVGYAIIDRTDLGAVVLVALRVRDDETYAAAYRRATVEVRSGDLKDVLGNKGVTWEPTSAIMNGASPAFAVTKYWGLRISRDPKTDVLSFATFSVDDPMINPPERFSEREAVHGKGSDDLKELLSVLRKQEAAAALSSTAPQGSTTRQK